MTESDLRLIREAIFDPRAFTPRLDEVREVVRRLEEPEAVNPYQWSGLSPRARQWAVGR